MNERTMLNNVMIVNVYLTHYILGPKKTKTTKTKQTDEEEEEEEELHLAFRLQMVKELTRSWLGHFKVVSIYPSSA